MDVNKDFFGAILGVCGECTGRYIKVGRGISIGRDETTAKLVLTNETISRKHCTITYDPEKAVYYVLDYSKNGIMREDGTRLPSGELCHFLEGEIIYIGNAETAFRFL